MSILTQGPEVTAEGFSTATFETAGISASVRGGLKRTFDVIVSGILLLSAAPLLLGIAAMIWISGGRPVIFSHKRVGRDGKSFGCLKFRTMVRDSDRVLAELLARSPEARAEWEATQKLRNDPRILGAIGRFLRRSSLDELPQLFNVLRGDMSLVGPRPVVDAELVHYGEQLPWYFAARPGLTGPWQVSGRSDTTYATRVNLDVNYVKNLSLRRDLGILFRTASVVLRSEGAY